MRILKAVLITLGDPGRLTGGYLFHRRMAELASKHGARLEFVSFPKRPFPLAAVAAPAVLARGRDLGADVLVLDSIAAAFLGPWLILHTPDSPIVGMLHQPPGGIDHGPVRATIQAALDRLAYRHARLLMVASESLAEQLRREGVPGSLLRVVPPGRDVASRPVQQAEGLRQGRRVAFLCVGNWVERKGILDLLEAFACLDAGDGTLHLVGDDSADRGYAKLVRARLSRTDLAGRVTVHGAVSRERVAALYQGSDVFVLPSFREPYGTVYGEAMATGLPVVGWKAGNLPYLAEHEREGLLVPPGDVEGLATAMERLARDEGLRHRLGDAALKRSETLPSWDGTAALFFRTLREVADGWSPATKGP